MIHLLDATNKIEKKQQNRNGRNCYGVTRNNSFNPHKQLKTMTMYI